VNRIFLLCLLLLAPGYAGAPAIPQDDGLLEILEEERGEARRLRRRGNYAAARQLLGAHLRDEPEDANSRALLAQVLFDEADWKAAERHARRALADAEGAELQILAGATLVELLLELGRVVEAGEALAEFEEHLDPGEDARHAWLAGRVSAAGGDPGGAPSLWRLGARGTGARDWREHLARARCLRALGSVEDAGRALVAADRLAREGEGEQADVLAELGSLYFEADREVAEGASRSAAGLFDAALALNPHHEAALLGLFEIHRTNYHRRNRSAQEFLERALKARPDSIDAQVAAISSHLSVGKLPAVRAALGRAESLAPERRDVRSLRAALAWVQHEKARCREILAQLLREKPGDSAPERVLGEHLILLYRFGEARPFLEAAVGRDSSDYLAWTLLGRALANTGDEPGALVALRRSKAEGGLRQDAWRKNMTLVLERLEKNYTQLDFGELSFSMLPESAAVLQVYLEPFYREAREELSGRYGFTPEPCHIEVFRRHEDFSVRSTGFGGFPALGVCFGPVVTALSPLSEMRGSFSWARTSFHEFTHVIHLGLSHNRCPRWITEGLATWEEKTANPAWDRNMRRDLIDARANNEIIPVRDLNAAFRGPRIIFGYYQGGLTCQMLIERYGFTPMIRLLEAFDAGLDLDQALLDVFGLTPEELDAELLAFIDRTLAPLSLEPRWSRRQLLRLAISMPAELPPESARAERADWQRDWCTRAYGNWQQGRDVDATEALRQVRRAGEDPPRALFLRGEMALAAGEHQEARKFTAAGLAAGGEDFRARVTLGALLLSEGQVAEAEEQLLAAERAFPGFSDKDLCAELRLAALYLDADRDDEGMAAAERWLAHDAGDLAWRRQVADWHALNERWPEAAGHLRHANQVDPFSSSLHIQWGAALEAQGLWEEALREYTVALLVPAKLDSDETPTGEERTRLTLAEGRCLAELGRLGEAREKLDASRSKGGELDEWRALEQRLQGDG